MANYLQLDAPVFALNGDGVTTTVIVDLAEYPLSVPFNGRFPDRVIVHISSPDVPDQVVQSSVKRSVVTFTLPRPQPPTDGEFALSVRITQQFDLI